jgi:hypothetical protein
MFTDPLKHLGLSQTESGSRSTVLKPLMWFLGITLSGAIGCFRFGAPIAVGVSVSALACLGSVVFLGVYIYFAITDKDALRSESFTIQKLALQSRLVGDDTSWTNTLKQLPSASRMSPSMALPSAESINGQDADDAEQKQ